MYRYVAALWQFEINDDWKIDIDHLCPEVAWYVDLCRRRCAFRLHNNAVQRFCDAGWVTYFFLVGNTVSEQVHLFHLLEAALTDCFVSGLWCNQKYRRVVPICCFNSSYEVGDAWAVLRDHHGHFAGGASETVSHHAARCFVGTVPESDARVREDVRDWHHGRADDPECVVDAVHL